MLPNQLAFVMLKLLGGHMTPHPARPDPLPRTEPTARVEASSSRGIAQAAASFAESRKRSVAVRSLRGPALSVGINENVQRPGASLLKLPLAMTLYDLAGAGHITLNMTVKRKDIESSRYPSILQVFDNSHAFLLSELCGIMLATSDNPSAQYILDLVGFPRVNTFLESRQCSDTRMAVGFHDYELDSPLARSSYSSAHDMAVLLRIAYSEAKYAPLLGFLTNGLRKSRVPLLLPEDLPIANKTGSIDGVVNDAAIIYGKDYDLSIAILTDAEENGPQTEHEIAGFAATVWESLGERLEELKE